MSEEEQIKLLATDGMLVKRPLIVADDFILTGFRKNEWKEKWSDVMKENKYDDPLFFEKYSQMDRSKKGWTVLANGRHWKICFLIFRKEGS